MYNVTCPYEGCGHSFEYDYPDGAPSDGDMVQIQCEECDKVFVAFASWSLSYLNEKIAPCLNGGLHKYEPRVGAPREYFIGRYACEYCDGETHFTPEEIKTLGLRVPEWWADKKENG